MFILKLPNGQLSPHMDLYNIQEDITSIVCLHGTV